MLEPTGRTSGRRRFVVLEVIEPPDPGGWLVVYADAHPRSGDHRPAVIGAAIGGSIEEHPGELPKMALDAVIEGVGGYSSSAM